MATDLSWAPEGVIGETIEDGSFVNFGDQTADFVGLTSDQERPRRQRAGDGQRAPRVVRSAPPIPAGGVWLEDCQSRGKKKLSAQEISEDGDTADVVVERVKAGDG